MLYIQMSTLDLTDSAHTYDFRLLPGNAPRFWPKWAAMQRSLWVLASYDGSWDITDYPGAKSIDTGDTAEADFVWYGGQSFEFTDTNGLATALDGLGYTVT